MIQDKASYYGKPIELICDLSNGVSFNDLECPPNSDFKVMPFNFDADICTDILSLHGL